MITVNCYNCGSDKHTHFMDENGFTMVRCSGCELLYIRNRPTDEDISVATAVGQHHGEQTLDANVRYNHFVKTEYRRALKQLFNGNFAGISTWLDIGCGYGEFIETIAEVSGGKIALSGSEPNQVKQASAKGRGLNVDYFDLGSHEGRYDMVSLMNVYSHLPDPVEFIGQMKNLLKPGGRLLLQTGDVVRFSAKDVLKPLGLPDHLSFVSEKILRDVFDRFGMNVETVVKLPDLPLRPVPIAKEVVKAILPQYDSYLKYYLNWWKYQDTNMYMLARMK